MNKKISLTNDDNDIDIRKSHYNELIKWKLSDKIFWTKKKIKEFINECINSEINEITISFSGGKDSTVLLDLVLIVHKEMNCKIWIVPIYATEITFPSTVVFIKETIKRYQEKYNYLKNPLIVFPKKTWNEILSENGYPIFSKQISTIINRVKKNKTQNSLTKWFFGIDKNITSTSRFILTRNRLFLLDDKILNNWPRLNDKKMIDYFKKYNDSYFFSEKCCDYIKGNLKHDMRPSFIGTMASESQLRKKSWIHNGCNIYNEYKKKSRPLSIWTNRDIWEYILTKKIEVNKMYNFDSSKPLNKQNLRFTRLGCTSCPYGSFIEQKRIELLSKKIHDCNDYRLYNRFEKLKEEYPNLYLSQVILNGMYKILIDMNILIKNDDLYMKLYDMRRKQINDWYSKKNERTNILRVMTQIENHMDYKKKGKNYEWSYTFDQFKQAMKHFNLEQPTIKEISSIRKLTKQEYKNAFKND